MIKSFFILFFGLLVNLSFSQSIKSTYIFKKIKTNTFEGTNKSWTDEQTDSLVLYNNLEFFRRINHFQFDNLSSISFKGQWEMKEGILYLNVTSKLNYYPEVWTEHYEKFKYLIKKNKLIPMNEDNFEDYGNRTLKLIK